MSTRRFMKNKKIYHTLLMGIILGGVFINTNVYAGECFLGPDVTKDLYGALKIFRILAPLLVIAYSTLDTVKALTKGDGGAELKKVAQRFGKRCIYAALLFFLPMLIDVFMQMADVWDANGNCLQEIENTGSPYTPQEACQAQGKTWVEATQECIDSNAYVNCSKYDGQAHNDGDRASCQAAGCTFNWDTGSCSPTPFNKCTAVSGERECNNMSGCYWSGGACKVDSNATTKATTTTTTTTTKGISAYFSSTTTADFSDLPVITLPTKPTTTADLSNLPDISVWTKPTGN